MLLLEVLARGDDLVVWLINAEPIWQVLLGYAVRFCVKRAAVWQLNAGYEVVLSSCRLDQTNGVSGVVCNLGVFFIVLLAVKFVQNRANEIHIIVGEPKQRARVLQKNVGV